ncbi:hypothetical protein CDIK_2805 [Cucumispora dikerogammari]|nr:hypothetical protein CDIK_2805 [Cucumispora dikerogammari]
MSDKDIGLLFVLSEAVPNSIKCSCVRHIAKNFKLRFRGVMLSKFWALVYENDSTVFDREFEKLRLENNKFYDLLNGLYIESWPNSKCLLLKYRKNTTNATEFMNSALQKFINLNIINLIIELNNYTMKKYNIRISYINTNIISEKILEEIEMNISMGRLCSISQSIHSLTETS